MKKAQNTRNKAKRVSRKRYSANWLNKVKLLKDSLVASCTGPTNLQCGASKDSSDILGSSAKIKTRFGSLCPEHKNGFSSAYVMVGATAGSDMNWAQVGFTTDHSLIGGYWNVAFAQVMTHSSMWTDWSYIHAPNPNEVVEWKCQLNFITGTWNFYMNGIKRFSHQNNAWKAVSEGGGGMRGLDAEFSGEVWYVQDKMPGTWDNICTFRNCKLEIFPSGWQDAAFVEGEFENDRVNLWQLVVSGEYPTNDFGMYQKVIP